jgi:hypothetical protein
MTAMQLMCAHVGDEGIAAIAPALRNMREQVSLHLDENKISEVGLAAMMPHLVQLFFVL